MKRFAYLLVVVFFAVSVVGCDSSKTVKVGEGVVTSEEKVKHPPKDEVKSKDTWTGAGVGAGTGAVVGGVMGAGVGTIGCVAMTVVTFGIGAVTCVPLIAGGAAVGAGLGAGGGALVGAGSGYIYASREHSMGMYEYNVVQDGQVSPLQFREYPSEHMPENTRVVIYESEYDGHKAYHIEPIEDDSKKKASKKSSS